MQREPFEFRADAIVTRIYSSNVAESDGLRPCSDEDIAALERARGVVLPRAYKLFLLRMGRGAGKFLTSDHWTAFYDDLAEVNESVREAVPLADEWFCFATRMGEIYLFFKADGREDDPPVYFWSEGTDPKIEMGFSSFWDWLGEMVSDHTRSTS